MMCSAAFTTSCRSFLFSPVQLGGGQHALTSSRSKTSVWLSPPDGRYTWSRWGQLTCEYQQSTSSLCMQSVFPDGLYCFLGFCWQFVGSFVIGWYQAYYGGDFTMEFVSIIFHVVTMDWIMDLLMKSSTDLWTIVLKFSIIDIHLPALLCIFCNQFDQCVVIKISQIFRKALTEVIIYEGSRIVFWTTRSLFEARAFVDFWLLELI